MLPARVRQYNAHVLFSGAHLLASATLIDDMSARPVGRLNKDTCGVSICCDPCEGPSPIKASRNALGKTVTRLHWMKASLSVHERVPARGTIWICQ